jgi:hypothetical protein
MKWENAFVLQNQKLKKKHKHLLPFCAMAEEKNGK